MSKFPLKPLKEEGFTFKGYNDKPKRCLNKKCKGMVYPTRNANVGKCNTCGRTFPWSAYLKAKKANVK